jgi:hypothetical protein
VWCKVLRNLVAIFSNTYEFIFLEEVSLPAWEIDYCLLEGFAVNSAKRPPPNPIV